MQCSPRACVTENGFSDRWCRGLWVGILLANSVGSVPCLATTCALVFLCPQPPTSALKLGGLLVPSSALSGVISPGQGMSWPQGQAQTGVSHTGGRRTPLVSGGTLLDGSWEKRLVADPLRPLCGTAPTKLILPSQQDLAGQLLLGTVSSLPP